MFSRTVFMFFVYVLYIHILSNIHFLYSICIYIYIYIYNSNVGIILHFNMYNSIVSDSITIKYHIYVFRYFIMKNNFKNKILKIFILIKLLGTLCDNMIQK